LDNISSIFYLFQNILDLPSSSSIFFKNILQKVIILNIFKIYSILILLYFRNIFRSLLPISSIFFKNILNQYIIYYFIFSKYFTKVIILNIFNTFYILKIFWIFHLLQKNIFTKIIILNIFEIYFYSNTFIFQKYFLNLSSFSSIFFKKIFLQKL